MKTNQKVVSDFKHGISSKSLNMTSTGDKLFSYYTCVAQWVDGQCVLNATKYSSTTSKQLSKLRGFEDIKTVAFVPRGTDDLTSYMPKEDKEKYLTYKDCYELVKSLSRSQGTYGRILEEWNQFDAEDIKKAEAKLKKLKFKTEVDFIIWLEN